jgi:hypothetical protein
MKIIFSRKGVDSQAGELSNAIIDEELIPIPIPAKKKTGRTRYRDFTVGNVKLTSLVEDLSPQKTNYDRRRGDELVHLDPDLPRDSLGEKGRIKASFRRLHDEFQF